MKTLALLALACLTAALPLANRSQNDDVILSVLSHDTYISEATCSWSYDTEACLQAIIRILTQTFLATYQNTSLRKRSITINDITLDLQPHHYADDIRGIRATEHIHSPSTRDANASAGGFVGDFYWLPLSSEVYDVFDKSAERIEVIATTISEHVKEFNATEICVDFGSEKVMTGGSIIANGVMTFGWGLESFYYADPTLLERRLKTDCQVGNMAMYGTHYRDVVLS